MVDFTIYLSFTTSADLDEGVKHTRVPPLTAIFVVVGCYGGDSGHICSPFPCIQTLVSIGSQ
jgi:hypothetical protein